MAKYSPSGFYIASAGIRINKNFTTFYIYFNFFKWNIKCYLDQSGKVRIWDTVNKEHILKNEFQPITGPIKDLSWSPDNQRMVVVGEGREKYLK